MTEQTQATKKQSKEPNAPAAKPAATAKQQAEEPTTMVVIGWGLIRTWKQVEDAKYPVGTPEDLEAALSTDASVAVYETSPPGALFIVDENNVKLFGVPGEDEDVPDSPSHDIGEAGSLLGKAPELKAVSCLWRDQSTGSS